ncbi:porin [Nisaea acidiphila]|uniref:Porin n=1 Tax=Nisaea acidiphila TaxID=1862145 RepID=A0A9J7AR13_9PROT|nr:porin [Nisaea acidiphila]UUX50051.1 porin [Nisaea acidiphila]
MKRMRHSKAALLQTTTLVAAGLILTAAPAEAAEKLKLSVGGYAEQWFGYTDIDDEGNQDLDLTGFDVKSDTEIHFKGTTTLDNGLEVGVNVQLEGNSDSGDQIDESYLTVSGKFGRIDIGDENSALYKTHVAPTEYGIGINSGDTVEWELTGATSISDSGYFRAPFGGTYIEPARTNDSTKLTYYTPRLEGFRLGISYAPDTNQDSNVQPDRNSGLTDGVMGGIDFRRDFNGVGLAASAGYGTFLQSGDGVDEPEAYAFGLTVDYAGFQVGGSYAGFTDSGANDGDGYTLGASYDFGEYGVSLTYLHGERDGIAGSVDPDTVQADRDSVALAGRYILGPGVSAETTLGYSEYTSDAAGAGDIEAAYVITGIRVTF